MRISPDLAETLAVVIDEGTLDAAARRLHITPSAVSQRIKSLEQHVGQVLLVRAKPARPTPAGRAVVRLARQVALLEHDAVAALGEPGQDVVSMPLAVNADSLATWFLPPLARLSERHPVVFDLHRDDQDFTAGLLEDGTVMAAVTSRAAPVAGCVVRAIGTLRYEAVATPGYAARHLPHGLDADALAVAPLVDFDRRDDIQRTWLAGRGVDPNAPPRCDWGAGGRCCRACSRRRRWMPATWCRWGVTPSMCRCTGSSGTCAPRCSTPWPPNSSPRGGGCWHDGGGCARDGGGPMLPGRRALSRR